MDFDSFAYTPVLGERRSDATVELDGNWFTGCRYERCELVFRGEHPFGYVDTKFIGCRFILAGRADMVLSHLVRMFSDEGLLVLARQFSADLPNMH